MVYDIQLREVLNIQHQMWNRVICASGERTPSKLSPDVVYHLATNVFHKVNGPIDGQVRRPMRIQLEV
jgi:hypothetical protein